MPEVPGDESPPVVTPIITGTLGQAGWYRSNVTVNWSVTDPESIILSTTGCNAVTLSADTVGTTLSCAAESDGGTTSVSKPFKVDKTAPAATAALSRAADENGWYNRAVSLGLRGEDATSGIASCSQPTYAGPDDPSVSLAGTCQDRAGNVSATAGVTLKYDGTPPTADARPSRPADETGWYTDPLTVSLVDGRDAMSGLESCDASKSYAGPDSASAVVTGACRDRAGNVAPLSFAFKYDGTAPAVTATRARDPNENGWYTAPIGVSFAGSDSIDASPSCSAATTYAGPDAAAAAVSGTCKDDAGNVGSRSLALKYDATPPDAVAVPAREADANGWYNSPIAVTFGGTDSTSGIGSCTEGRTYSGPDTPSVSLSGSCSDRAGNQSPTAALAISYDATAPEVLGAAPVRPPDRAGWYNRPVEFDVKGADVTSRLDTCPTVTYAGPDGATASVAAVCVDRAGNRATRGFALRYDATGPSTKATPDRPPDSNGWYNQPLTVGFTGEDGVSGLESCGPPERYEGPDSDLVVVGGVCTDRAGNIGLDSLAVGYDATAPIVTGVGADRPPDANGWYNHPLVVGFQGTDATSQIAGCTTATYAGPDSSATSVSGSCTDRAGNSSEAMPFTLRYDGTAPSLGQVRAKAGNGTNTLTWTPSSDTALVQIRRAGAVVYSGGGSSYTDKGLKNGVRYAYTLTAYDEAGNAATSAAAARPSGPLVAPAAGAVVSGPPRLAWAAVPKATYYNVQLWRRGKILSAWPRGTSLRLARSWTYQGRRYRLTEGRYRWYVWAGYGPQRQKRFGKLLGSSSFVVR